MRSGVRPSSRRPFVWMETYSHVVRALIPSQFGLIDEVIRTFDKMDDNASPWIVFQIVSNVEIIQSSLTCALSSYF